MPKSKSKIVVLYSLIIISLSSISLVIPLSNSEGYSIYLPLILKDTRSPFGVTMYHSTSTSERDLMKAAGCKWAQIFLRWSDIEPNEPVNGVHTYNWAAWDNILSFLKDGGIEAIVIFTGNPSWAAEYVGGPLYPNQIQNLLDMASAMAERYDCDGYQDAPGCLRVRYWTFYPEPDNGSLYYAQQGWGYWGHNGSGYAEMISKVAPVIHNANPQAMVIPGAVAYDWFEEYGGPFVRSFLGDVLNALNSYPGGARAYIDGIGFVYFHLLFPTLRDKALEMKGILNNQGLADLPIIVPEMGYSSDGSSDETLQAQKLVEMFTQGIDLGIKIMGWYHIYDTPDSKMGLLREDRSPKPAYDEYKRLATPYN